MVIDPADYNWSSYRSNGFGINSKLITPHPLYLLLGQSSAERLRNYRDLFKSHIDGELLTDIRLALNTGLVLGTERFKAEVEQMTGKRTMPMKRGRKPGKITVF